MEHLLLEELHLMRELANGLPVAFDDLLLDVQFLASLGPPLVESFDLPVVSQG